MAGRFKCPFGNLIGDDCKWLDSNFRDHLGLEDELGDDDRVIFGNAAGGIEVRLEIGVRVRHVHRGAAQHVGRTHEARVPHLLTELTGALEQEHQNKGAR